MKAHDPKMIGERVRMLREQSGFTLRQLAEKVGVGNSFLSELERGKTGVSKPVLAQIASAFNISPDELLGETPVVTIRPKQRGLTEDEARLMSAYRGLPKKDRPVVLRMLECFAAGSSKLAQPTIESIEPVHERIVEETRTRVLQFIDAAAGIPLDAEAVPEEMEVPSEVAVGDNVALARAVGDSMTGIGIENHDVLLVEVVASTKNYNVGDIVVARINESEYVVKRYGGHRQRKRIFLSENKTYEPLIVETTRSSIEAVVLARRTKAGEWVAVPSGMAPNRS